MPVDARPCRTTREQFVRDLTSVRCRIATALGRGSLLTFDGVSNRKTPRGLGGVRSRSTRAFGGSLRSAIPESREIRPNSTEPPAMEGVTLARAWGSAAELNPNATSYRQGPNKTRRPICAFLTGRFEPKRSAYSDGAPWGMNQT